MAFDLSKLNFFSRLDARARVLVLFAGIIAAGAAIYFLSGYISSDSSLGSQSTLAKPPAGIASVPGSEVTSTYRGALDTSDADALKGARDKATSAIPTIRKTASGGVGVDANCTILCDDASIDVKSTLNDMVSKGKMTSEVSTMLQGLVDSNVSVAEFGAALADLVKQGKLTPEQARQLMEQYKKQHANLGLKDSATVMDDLIKAGKLPLDAANMLLDAQKRGVSVAEYADLLQDMVKKGLISPETAQRLLSDYMKSQQKEAVGQTKSLLNDMVQDGTLTRPVKEEIDKLMAGGATLDTLDARLQQLVSEGKLTAAAAKKIRDEYARQKGLSNQISVINKMIKSAEDAAYAELVELQANKQITPETAATIKTAIDQNVSAADFQAMIAGMVQQGALSPEISKLKLADYKKVKDLRDLRDKLLQLQANGATEQEYQDALKAAAVAGVVTPEEAAQLMSEYHVMRMQPETTTLNIGDAASDESYRKMMDAINSGKLAGTAQPAATTDTGAPGGAATAVYSDAEKQAMREEQARKQAHLQAVATGMAGQAQQLIASWSPPTMFHMAGTPIDKTPKAAGSASGSAGSASAGTTTTQTTDTTTNAPALIKAGTILFAVLDTTINSDYPESPVLATVVEGKYKGAKLLGKLQVTKSTASGQMDRIMLNFSLMNMDEWGKSKSTNAFAIDPDTARSALASNVNYHYMQRFGALMATSFLQGYGSAAMSSGGTQVASAFGTSSTNPQLSPSSKLAVAIGQMAQAVGTATQGYTNRPPTVVVDSGVGLGILFMTDLS